MTRFGYDASHEQHRPSALLEYVRAAEDAGFEGAMCSDHFHPWLNEAITGEHWPPKSERNARLEESVEVIRALWRGETVTHHGRVRVEEATLYTRPDEPPRLY